tara:strand:- start:217 stop:879 length:663 start_codon:yes stop_codon:yes gene_type:complete
MIKHKHYDSAYKAYYATSFSPEERAIFECNFFDEINKEFTELGADERAFTKFESLFLASLNAKSNCMSSMITEPANFPVARMEKMNNRERAITQEMYNFIDKVKKAINKVNNPSTDIRSYDKDAITKLKEKLAKLEKSRDQMKACNKIARDKKDNKIERLTEILGSEESAKEILEPSSFGAVGFESFSLTFDRIITTLKLKVQKKELHSLKHKKEERRQH